MKRENITKENGYKLIPIVFSKLGLKTFGNYKARKPYLVKYVSCRPKKGKRMEKDTIAVLFEGRKETQKWHKDFFIIPKLD